MKLVLLGTTGYHPNDRRHTACLMLPELGLVLDAGSAMYRVRDYLQTPELDIFVSHAHLDHVMGLTFLYDVIFEKSIQRVTVHGAAHHLDAIQAHLFASAIFPADPPCSFSPLERSPIELPNDGRLTFFPMEHPGGSTGYRLDWAGHSLAYITDTIASLEAPYLQQIANVDLLVHECYFPDAMHDWATKTGHSATTQVAQVARAANVRRLVLVHVNPLSSEDDPIGLDVARKIFPATEIGCDLQEIEF